MILAFWAAVGGRPGMAYHADGDDPYITLDDAEDTDSEAEDVEIKPSDLLILTARNEDDVSNLEVRRIYSSPGFQMAIVQ